LIERHAPFFAVKLLSGAVMVPAASPAATVNIFIVDPGLEPIRRARERDALRFAHRVVVRVVEG